jgi:hypothetical protein
MKPQTGDHRHLQRDCQRARPISVSVSQTSQPPRNKVGITTNIGSNGVPERRAGMIGQPRPLPGIAQESDALATT